MTGRVHDMIIDPKQTGMLGEVVAEGGYYGMQTFDQHLLEHLQRRPDHDGGRDARRLLAARLQAAWSPRRRGSARARTRTRARARSRARLRRSRARTRRRRRRLRPRLPAASARRLPGRAAGGPQRAATPQLRRRRGASPRPRRRRAPSSVGRRPRSSDADSRVADKVRGASSSPDERTCPVQTTLAQFNETQSHGGLRAAELEAAEGRARTRSRSRRSSARWSPTRAT